MDATNPSDLLTLSAAAKLLPHRNGRKMHVMTIKRWILRGCRGVYLKGRRVGNEWYTTAVDLAEFEVQCTARSLGVARNPTPDTRLSEAAAVSELRGKGYFQPRKRRLPSSIPSILTNAITGMTPAVT
jgi:hypothetical protein